LKQLETRNQFLLAPKKQKEEEAKKLAKRKKAEKEDEAKGRVRKVKNENESLTNHSKLP
jgi:hypothetical protein